MNLLEQGDIAQKTFEQICDLCRKFSRNESRSTRGRRSKTNKLGSTDAMIIGLENKMDNMKIEIMNTVSKQIDSLKFHQKIEKEQESLSIFCPKCRKKHLLRECPLDIKETNKCAICTENHAIVKNVPTYLG